MLYVFYLDIAYACNGFQVFSGVLQVLQTYVASVLDKCCRRFSYLRRILQVFHLDVAKVDRVLHMLQRDPLVMVAYCNC